MQNLFIDEMDDLDSFFRNLFLLKGRELKGKKCVLIFDEVMCGFRTELHGAQGKYGIIPDMTCLGKIIGGGLPAAAYGGKRDIMNCIAPDGSVYQAGTLSGNPLAVTAGLETLQMIRTIPDFYKILEEKDKETARRLAGCGSRSRCGGTGPSVGIHVLSLL